MTGEFNKARMLEEMHRAVADDEERKRQRDRERLKLLSIENYTDPLEIIINSLEQINSMFQREIAVTYFEHNAKRPYTIKPEPTVADLLRLKMAVSEKPRIGESYSAAEVQDALGRDALRQLRVYRNAQQEPHFFFDSEIRAKPRV